MSVRTISAILGVALLLAGAGVGIFLLATRNPSEIAAAEEALARRDFSGASEHLNKYLASHPADTQALLLAAQASRRGGDYATAAAFLKKCDRSSRYTQAIELEGRCLRAQQGDFRECSALLKEYGDPSAPEAALACEAVALGILALHGPTEGTLFLVQPEVEGRIRLGVQAATLWLELRGAREDQAAGLSWRGRLRSLVGDYTSAVNDLRRSIELDSQSSETRYALALLIAQESPEEAALHLTMLRQQQPKDQRILFALATAYHGLGRLEAAAATLDELLALEPKHPAILRERAEVALSASQLDLAERLLEQALAVAPNDPAVHHTMSRCMQFTGRPDKMKFHQARFLELDKLRKGSSTPPSNR